MEYGLDALPPVRPVLSPPYGILEHTTSVVRGRRERYLHVTNVIHFGFDNSGNCRRNLVVGFKLYFRDSFVYGFDHLVLSDGLKHIVHLGLLDA